MPSPRRVKVFFLLIFLFVITILFYTASLRQSRTQDPRTLSDFYSKTLSALDKKPPNTGTGTNRNEEDEKIAKAMAESLKEAAQIAKDNANAKAPKPDPPSAVVGMGNAAQGGREEKGVAGRKKYPMGDGTQEVVKEEEESAEDHEVEMELNGILKKSPSRSYYSPSLSTWVNFPAANVTTQQ